MIKRQKTKEYTKNCDIKIEYLLVCLEIAYISVHKLVPVTKVNKYNSF